ncbi:hypothetical protein ACN23B_16555 [Anabaena sp. FACHB-709]|uniref:Uncharacterized protein n=2 Tax=Nostocaceae TaxID=1162 RepID=A0A1Z4KJ22_ANAVA|nr:MULTISPECIES: hypothetical protein [Nostocaceae]BAY68924.1 hypothetical protein NIES23_17140 [Trichormus variabilis NIES-23]HBW33432.1 hypothetical protein [Nostoc sp. UBA8866]MBD2170497.1 hypothetical protein [Anabaena cylindrica FACHB-318]MBD2262027.1 hypothetical protein [Anabaena sp. FACHB-709]MBD2271829.1 hypothetical protein [Nostoc sp. PCC 7120 = FACHB-418]
MQLNIVEDKLQLEFTWQEQLLAVRFQKLWLIPLAHIKQTTITKPQSSWKELRAPGSFIPGIIKAGTYYTERGKEFWYVNRDNSYLNIELQDESYERIILTIDNSNYWLQKLTQV